VDTYSKKYDPPKQTLPDLKRIKLDKKMFPKELWDVLEGESGEKIKADIAKAGEKKAAMLGTFLWHKDGGCYNQLRVNQCCDGVISGRNTPRYRLTGRRCPCYSNEWCNQG